MFGTAQNIVAELQQQPPTQWIMFDLKIYVTVFSKNLEKKKFETFYVAQMFTRLPVCLHRLAERVQEKVDNCRRFAIVKQTGGEKASGCIQTESSGSSGRCLSVRISRQTYCVCLESGMYHNVLVLAVLDSVTHALYAMPSFSLSAKGGHSR